MPVSAIRRFFVMASMALLTLAAAHAEEQCSLKVAASLDLLDNPGGTPMVAVTFNGRPAKMILDTGAYWSGITPSAAAGLKTKSLAYIGAVGAGGGTMRTAAVVPELQIGRLKFVGADFFVFARDDANDPELVGNIGANILKNYDVEIDYPGRKVRIYLQDHCPGRVVSWTYQDLAKIPFKLNKVGHISLPVTLDGHDYRALLDTGATATYLDKRIADGDFGLTAETGKAIGTSDTLDGKDLPTFYHRFGLLDLGGLQFRNTPLAFSTDQTEGGAAGWEQERMPSVTLGMHQLRALHFYIAYGEKMIYASVAAAGPLTLDSIDREDLGQFEERAERQIADRDYDGAQTTLTQALRLAPGESSLFASRAYVRQQMGDLPAAIADLDDAVRLAPKSAQVLAGRCTLKIQSHLFDAAMTDCEQALALDAKEQEARLDRVYLYLQRRQPDLALADCNLVLAEDPQSAPALAYLGQIRQVLAATSQKRP
jgi:predicted aspartyl protease/Tfp pilus assembly protein PilF